MKPIISLLILFVAFLSAILFLPFNYLILFSFLVLIGINSIDRNLISSSQNKNNIKFNFFNKTILKEEESEIEK